MHFITSPFLVVPVIAAVFFACIFWATSSREDVATDASLEHDHGH
jgi:hypothetical protein